MEGEGVTGLETPFNHDDPADIDEQAALEYPATLSVLARVVDESSAESPT